MSAGLLRMIESGVKDDDLKAILKQVVSELDRTNKYRQQDLIFTKGNPVVLNGDDGHYYAIKVTGTTAAVELDDMGRKVP